MSHTTHPGHTRLLTSADPDHRRRNLAGPNRHDRRRRSG